MSLPPVQSLPELPKASRSAVLNRHKDRGNRQEGKRHEKSTPATPISAASKEAARRAAAVQDAAKGAAAFADAALAAAGIIASATGPTEDDAPPYIEDEDEEEMQIPRDSDDIRKDVEAEIRFMGLEEPVKDME